MIYEDFIDGAGKALSGTFQLDSTLNAYVEEATLPGGKTAKALYAAPGTAGFKDFGILGPIRGMLNVENYAYIVCGTNVYGKDSNDVYTLLGTVVTDDLPVRMVANQTQVFLRSAGKGYVIQAGAVTLIGAIPWLTLQDIEYLDGYFIALDNDGGPVGGQFFISSPEDCTTWDPLDFSTAPSSNNKLLALCVINKSLFVIGSITTQPFYNNGNADFPIVPNQSGNIERGTTARDSVTKLSNEPQSSASTFFMMTESTEGHAEVVKIQGFSAVVISTPQITRILQGYATIDDSIGWAFEMGGHVFLQLNFPNAQASWRFDSTTNRWFKVSWFNAASGLQESQRGSCHIFNKNRHIIGDRSYGVLWLLSQDTYSDGDPLDFAAVVPQFMQREVLLPSAGTTRMFLPYVELLAEVGVGDGTGSGAGNDPTVDMELSTDGGRTYGDPISQDLGKQGEYDTRVQWQRNGSGRQLAIRMTCSAPVKRVWSGIDIIQQQGRT